MYIVGPLVGGVLAALLYNFVLRRMHEKGAEEAIENGEFLAAEDKLL